MNAENDENSYTFSQSSYSNALQTYPQHFWRSILPLDYILYSHIAHITIYTKTHTSQFHGNNRPGIMWYIYVCMYIYIPFQTSYLPADRTTLHYTYPILLQRIAIFQIIPSGFIKIHKSYKKGMLLQFVKYYLCFLCMLALLYGYRRYFLCNKHVYG